MPLPENPNEPPGHPTGNALFWSPADIARLAEVTPADVAEARDLWRKHVTEGGKSLLDARVDE